MVDLTVLRPGTHPLLVSRPYAAALLSISERHFDALVAQGAMPRARIAGARMLWSRPEIEEAVSSLPTRNAPQLGNSWDDDK